MHSDSERLHRACGHLRVPELSGASHRGLRRVAHELLVGTLWLRRFQPLDGLGLAMIPLLMLSAFVHRQMRTIDLMGVVAAVGVALMMVYPLGKIRPQMGNTYER